MTTWGQLRPKGSIRLESAAHSIAVIKGIRRQFGSVPLPDLSRCSKLRQAYSISSSAVESSIGGASRPGKATPHGAAREAALPRRASRRDASTQFAPVMKLHVVAHAAPPGLRLNEHLDHDDGPLVFEHACKLGLEGEALT
jgi:hypothetical protein